MRESARKLIVSYFDAFQNANTEALNRLLWDDIKLIDWAVSKDGKEDVIAMMSDFVTSQKDVQVVIKKIFIDENDMVATAMINIVIEPNEGETISLNVVDVIDYYMQDDGEGFITSITAYKQ